MPEDQRRVVERLRERVDRLVLVILSGRPLILDGMEEIADAIVAAWLPGSEGAGVADPMVGSTPYTGRLAYRWPRRQEQIPLHPFHPEFDPSADADALWPIGHRASSAAPPLTKGSVR